MNKNDFERLSAEATSFRQSVYPSARNAYTFETHMLKTTDIMRQYVILSAIFYHDVQCMRKHR